jgi:tol-pal system protein YbgF
MMMANRHLKALAAGVALAVLMAGAVEAQSGADRRLDRVERDLKTLQSVVLQSQATGQPVVVRPEGADPAVTAMAARVDDLEMTLQRINGQVETIGHDLDQIRRAEQASEAERRAQDKLVGDRLSRLEGQIAALTQAATAADPGVADAGPPPAFDARRGPKAGAEATARAQAQDTGVLGGRAPAPPPPLPLPPSGPNESFAAARALLATNQAPAAADAFQDFISRYPTNARTPEAYYWLGESFFTQRGYQNATAAYASALRNRPTTTWAPAAMVRLAQALSQSNQNDQACAALSEFDQRYAAKAAAAIKTNAEAVRRRARCM